MAEAAEARPGGWPGGRHWAWFWIVPIAIIGWLLLTAPGRAAGGTFLASLRIARPKGVSVSIPAFAGPTGTRRLQDAVAAMLADSVHVLRDAADSTVADASSAARLAGFAPQLPAARHDAPVLSVESERAVAMQVDRSQLRTILGEAGRSPAAVPASLNGSTLAITTPAGIRAQYGHCPVPVSTSLQNQLVGQPPPTTDNGDCIELVERPAVTARVPAGLDMPQLVGVALEVAGMSPRQTQDFQQLFDWRAALALTMPRFMRSYDSARVSGAPAMLLNTAGRRGPTYDLIWARGGLVYSLAGYGSAADAAPVASSIP